MNLLIVSLLMKMFPIQTVTKKGRAVRALDIASQVDRATTEALRYMARTKQRRTYLPYTFPAVAGTHLPTREDGGLSKPRPTVAT